jgi:hypothetical protein
MTTLYVGLWSFDPPRAAHRFDFFPAVSENEAIGWAINKSSYHYSAGKKVYDKSPAIQQAIENGDYIFQP